MTREPRKHRPAFGVELRPQPLALVAQGLHRKHRPAFGVELRWGGMRAFRVYGQTGLLLWQGDPREARLALPELPEGDPVMVTRSELSAEQTEFGTGYIEGWDHAAVKRAEDLGLLK